MPAVFYAMTLGEYQLHAEGYQIRQAREWERTRLLISSMMNLMGGNTTPTSLFSLITDGINKSRQMTRDEAISFHERTMKIKNWEGYFNG